MYKLTGSRFGQANPQLSYSHCQPQLQFTARLLLTKSREREREIQIHRVLLHNCTISLEYGIIKSKSNLLQA